MASHYPTVSGLVKTLTSAIEFEANTEGHAALTAMRSLPAALAYRSHHHSVTLLPRRLIDASVVTGVWKRLVFGHPARTDGLVDRNANVFGGLVAAIDGMRFVVPVPSAYARPNKKFFGQKRGVTWLNMINDQAMGIGSKVVSGTERDCLHALDVVFASGEGRHADVIITDTGSYSDLAFGLAHLTDKEYRPALADLPDQKLWRTDPGADYGALN